MGSSPVQRLIQRLGDALSLGKAKRHDISGSVQAYITNATASGRFVQCNLGCGTRHHPEWLNIDFHGNGKTVLAYDLRKGVPLPSNSCDALYASHIIEHFDREGAQFFLTECARVLKPHGVIRLAAPDLEGIVRTYLSCLDAARRGDSGADDRYKWIVIELLDQLVRHRSGGEMLRYWASDTVPAEDFVAARVGVEYSRARQHLKNRSTPNHAVTATALGLFRLGGEVHQWMYDSYSLGKLLSECGFIAVTARDAAESDIANFVSFNLDTEPDGSVCKPDSFYIEAKAP